ncbi:hypothetical protein D7V78_06185 [Parabacteroides distasonis]|uniref:Uncharacterized protein n=1 Tax=Parabacteroides distasonis TaxID=823 RepID=A0A3L7ZSH8_PARDI|nr:hypothetical protein [Parabacteroides distasonis]RLT74231.1 hypothetical protein D7V78_06185 [Parabacteroides distasonis]
MSGLSSVGARTIASSLRNKSNCIVLEGLLSTLLGEDVAIVHILESEGNKEDSENKFNRINMLTENNKSKLIINEVQNNRELGYFHRMLYSTSKAVSEYIHVRREIWYHSELHRVLLPKR